MPTLVGMFCDDVLSGGHSEAIEAHTGGVDLGLGESVVTLLDEGTGFLRAYIAFTFSGEVR